MLNISVIKFDRTFDKPNFIKIHNRLLKVESAEQFEILQLPLWFSLPGLNLLTSKYWIIKTSPNLAILLYRHCTKLKVWLHLVENYCSFSHWYLKTLWMCLVDISIIPSSVTFSLGILDILKYYPAIQFIAMKDELCFFLSMLFGTL